MHTQGFIRVLCPLHKLSVALTQSCPLTEPRADEEAVCRSVEALLSQFTESLFHGTHVTKSQHLLARVRDCVD